MRRISEQTPLLLASGSPRRRELLLAQGIPLVVLAASVDETRLEGEAADRYLERIVSAKLEAARALPTAATAAAILVADTSVIVDADVLGKPESASDARAMITRLQGRAHEVHTRFAIAASPSLHAETIVTQVIFRALTGAEIDRYVATGEGTDKAGAYAIQGIGAALVSAIHGSYTNVVGLPASEVMQALAKMDLF